MSVDQLARPRAASVDDARPRPVERPADLNRPDPGRADPSRADPTRRGSGGRLTSLDGLRGVASLVVVLHHLSLIAAAYAQPSGDPPAFSFWWWEERTPLKLLTAGREAVLVFFVLSGLVVALPALKRIDFSWPGFLAGRFIRLYLPSWAALALGFLLVVVVPRAQTQVTHGAWIQTGTQRTIDWARLLDQTSLMSSPYSYDNVLWTLRWEITFSLLLPVFIVVAMAVRRWWAPVGALALGLAVLGFVIGFDPLTYLPVFFLGTLTAAKLPELQAWAAGLSDRAGRWIWGGAVAGSVLVLIADFLLLPVAPAGSTGGNALQGLSVAGALGLVVAAVGSRGLRAFLDTRPAQFLGRISFSLYLVHVPLIVAIGYLIGDWNWPVLVPVGITVALVGAALFFRFVEHPLHGLARRTNAATVRLIERATSNR